MDEEKQEGQKQEAVESEDKYKQIEQILKKVYKVSIIIALIISTGLLLVFNPFWPFLKENRCNLYVHSNPEGAKVYINGHDTHKLTPCTISTLRSGTYSISIAKEGISNQFNTKVSLQKGIWKVVYANLMQDKTSEIATHDLYIDTNPEGAPIEINGIPEGNSPLKIQAKEGKYDLFVKPFGDFLPIFKNITIAKSNKSIHLAFTLKKMPEENIFTWNSFNNDLPKQIYWNIGIKKLFISPFNPNVMFLSISFLLNTILFRSTDGGKHWYIAKAFPGKVVLHILFSYKNPSCVYAANFDNEVSINDSNYAYKIYRSEDLGKTWQSFRLPGDRWLNLHDFAISPNDDNVIYIASSFGGFETSLDGGKHWKKIEGLPKGFEPMDFNIVKSNPNIIYALGNGKNFLIKSTDGGKTWKTIHPRIEPKYKDLFWVKIVANPTNPDEIFVKASYQIEDKNEDNPEEKMVLYHSTDGGRHFKELFLQNSKDSFTFVNFVVTSDGVLYASDLGKEILEYKNGKTYKINIGDYAYRIYMPNYKSKYPCVATQGDYPIGIGSSILKIAGSSVISLDNISYDIGFFNIAYPHFSGKDGRELYAVIGNQYLMKSLDFGKHWLLVYKIPYGLKNLLKQPSIFTVFNNTFYILAEKNLLISNDYGKHFSTIKLSVNIPLSNSSLTKCNGLLVNPLDKDNIIIYNKMNLFVTRDRGKSFKIIRTSDIGTLLKASIINSKDETIIYALTTKGLYRSVNEGNSWEKLTLSYYTDRSTPSEFTILQGTQPSIIAITKNGILFKSTDLGKTFKPISIDFYGKNAIAFNRPTLFSMQSSSGTKIILFIPGIGMYLSADEGNTWKSVLGETPISDRIKSISTRYYMAVLPAKKMVITITSIDYGVITGIAKGAEN